MQTRNEAEKAVRSNGLVECQGCGGKWSPMLGDGGRLPRGWRKCPHCGHVNWERQTVGGQK